MSSPILGGRWDDVSLLAIATGTGGTPAAKVVYRGELELFSFLSSGTDQMGGSIELPHGYQEGTSLVPHIHWATNSTDATGGDIVWAIEYSRSNPQPGSSETYVAFASTTQTVAAGNRQYLANQFDFPAIANAAGTVSTLFSFNIKRIGSSASDTYPVSAFVKSLSLHIQLDTVGSNSQSSKN